MDIRAVGWQPGPGHDVQHSAAVRREKTVGRQAALLLLSSYFPSASFMGRANRAGTVC